MQFANFPVAYAILRFVQSALCSVRTVNQATSRYGLKMSGAHKTVRNYGSVVSYLISVELRDLEQYSIGLIILSVSCSNTKPT